MTEVYGHMIGEITANSVCFWIGVLSTESKSQIEVKNVIKIFDSYGALLDKISFQIEQLPEHTIDGKKIYIGRWLAKSTNLEPNTKCSYTLKIDGSSLSNPYSYTGEFVTSPENNVRDNVKILLSSCQMVYNTNKEARNNRADPDQKVWKKIRKLGYDFNAALFLGDTHYANTYKREEKWIATFHQFKIKGYQKLLGNTASYAIYDDHDFLGDNVCGAGNSALHRPKEDRPRRVQASKDFHELWMIPKPKTRTEEEGIYHKVKLGQVDIYMLDTRFYREPKNRLTDAKRLQNRGLSLLGSKGTVLKSSMIGIRYEDSEVEIGNKQWVWLKKQFAKYHSKPRTQQRVKLVCFGSVFNPKVGAKDHSEKIRHYQSAIKKLKKLLAGHQNVFFLTGDIHRLHNTIHSDFDPPIPEITSSGIGIKGKGGFVTLDIFPNQENKLIASFYHHNKTVETIEYDLIGENV